MNYQEIIQQLELAGPPSDWLTRATKAAGVDGADWAGLLEHVSRQGQDREKMAAMGQSLEAESKRVDELKRQAKATASNYTHARIYDELDADAELADAGDSDELDGEVRKLRERAVAAENELSVVRLRIGGRDDRIEELEAKLTMTEATAAQLGIGPLIPVKPTPTQSDLSRIAAALEKIANG